MIQLVGGGGGVPPHVAAVVVVVVALGLLDVVRGDGEEEGREE